MTAHGIRWLAGQVGHGGGHPELCHQGWAALPSRPLVSNGCPAPNTMTCPLPAARESVKLARDFARTTLREWALVELCDDVETVVSELVTNALRHALSPDGRGPRRVAPPGVSTERPVRVKLLRKTPHLMCLVTDPSDETPTVKDPDYIAETGRGLHVVEAMSRRWGWARLDEGGKVVWALFHSPTGW